MQAEQLGGHGMGCGQGLGASTWTRLGMESVVCSYRCCWVCSLAGEMNPDQRGTRQQALGTGAAPWGDGSGGSTRGLLTTGLRMGAVLRPPEATSELCLLLFWLCNAGGGEWETGKMVEESAEQLLPQEAQRILHPAAA